MSAYEMNRLMYDLREPESRSSLLASLDDHMDRYDLTADERQMLVDHDWQGLVDRGVSVYVLTKIGAVLDISLIAMGAAMRGMTAEEFREFVSEQNEKNAGYAILPA